MRNTTLTIVLLAATVCAEPTSLDPAALIPVVALASADGSAGTSSALDPAQWCPDATTQAPAVLQVHSDVCLENNGSRVLVHDIGQRFCVFDAGSVCSDRNHQGLCPHAQQGLPNGAQCTALPSSKESHVYGCIAKNSTEQATPSCHLRSSSSKR